MGGLGGGSCDILYGSASFGAQMEAQTLRQLLQPMNNNQEDQAVPHLLHGWDREVAKLRSKLTECLLPIIVLPLLYPQSQA